MCQSPSEVAEGYSSNCTERVLTQRDQPGRPSEEADGKEERDIDDGARPRGEIQAGKWRNHDEGDQGERTSEQTDAHGGVP